VPHLALVRMPAGTFRGAIKDGLNRATYGSNLILAADVKPEVGYRLSHVSRPREARLEKSPA